MPGRTRLYVVGAGLAAIFILFTNLGGPRLDGDEALYALCTDRILASGDWLTLSPHPPTAYFEKPPLYMWLTALSHRALPGLELKYRFWSAASGVVCVAMTCALGSRLLSPEAGLMGAMFLLLNRKFTVEHGARSGVMDAAATLCMVAAACSYVRSGFWMVLEGRRGPWRSAVVVGIATGIACWLKPLAGIPMVALLALHAVSYAPRGRRRQILAPLLVAAAVMVAVAAPWYAMEWARYGKGFVNAVLGRNIIARATTTIDVRHAQGGWYYVQEVTASSVPFLFCVPALVMVSGIALFERGAAMRRDHGLLAIVAVGWVAAFSVSRSKFLHYTYPAFPFIALAIAASIEGAIRHFVRNDPIEASRARFRTRVISITLGALGVAFCRDVYAEMPKQTRAYVPWELYQTFRPAIDRGAVQLLFAGVPAAANAWSEETDITPGDFFYLSHMRHVTLIVTAASLQSSLATERPTLLILSRELGKPDLYDQLKLEDRLDPRFRAAERAFDVLALDLMGLLQIKSSGAEARPFVAFEEGVQTNEGFRFSGSLSAHVTPPLPADMLLTLVIRPVPGMEAMVVRPVTMVDDQPQSVGGAARFADGLRVTALLDLRPHAPAAVRQVRFRLQPADGRSASIGGVVTTTTLTVLPQVPQENVNRPKR